MTKTMPLLFALVLTACGQSEAPVPAPLPTIDALVADPEQLRAHQQQCKVDRAGLGDELCNRIAAATRKRLFGDWALSDTPFDERPRF